MPRPARLTPLIAVLLATLSTLALSTPAFSTLALPATSAGAETGSTVQVRGTLLVLPSERPGHAARYAVALADGDIVPMRGAFGPGARTGALFEGRLAVPASVARALAARGESGPSAALRVVDRRSLVLSVVGAPSITAAAPALTPTTHEQFVAAVDNKGALGQDDAQLLAHVSTVGSYWTGESDGAIAGVTVPSTVTHYDTALPTTDCGLGSDFFGVVQEAEAEFPGFSFGGGDQLVVFVPPACSSGSVVGEGTLGSSFASGGALVVKAGTAVEGTYAHETGHNYGFEHANARVSGTSMEYYGAYDVMGFAIGGVNQLTALSTPFRVFQGITDPGEIHKVDLGTLKKPVHASATIRPRSDGSGLRSVEVTDPDTGEHLYLDYRAGTGEDAGSFYSENGSLGYSGGSLHYAPGVLVTAARDGAGTDVLVVDGDGDTSLASGRSWTNASGDLKVSVTGITAAGAHVTVDYDPAVSVLTSARPVIHGRAKVGRTLRVRHGRWSPGTTFFYRWSAGGKALRHQTSARLTLTKQRRGERIAVKVTGTKRGFPTVSRMSARTTKVT
ncbi:MAG TPA: hypothetical protein VH085_01920 [Nocardioides sp.]|nr:hypothetical protein [Nocardioides sp.]